MAFKKKTKKKLAYILLMISAVVLMFNNVGQLLTWFNIPFSRNTQIGVGIAGLIIGFIWYSYLEGAIK